MPFSIRRAVTPFIVMTIVALNPVFADVGKAGVSPWGPKDEIGRLNLMTPNSRGEILSRLDGRTIYDLSTDYFVGMPSFSWAGEPGYQISMLHTPRGTIIDDLYHVGEEMNKRVTYSSSAVSLAVHTGTHIDSFNHFGLNGKIWNGFSADEYVGDRGWHIGGIEAFPPIIARGVLIDVAADKGVEMLEDGYRISAKDLSIALRNQGIDVKEGDVVLIRTGRMQVFGDAAAFLNNSPGLSLEGAKYLVETKGAMVIGVDNLSVETFPSTVKDNTVPVHTYLLAEQGAPMIESIFLEELSRDKVYEFAFFGGPLKLKGADGAPLRPIAIPLH